MKKILWKIMEHILSQYNRSSQKRYGNIVANPDSILVVLFGFATYWQMSMATVEHAWYHLVKVLISR